MPASAAIFISYAREDVLAAERIAEALRSQGLEVWFDQSELRGGDAWDVKIRKQIASCALFVPVISANTQTRREGYFRLEWKLAAQRTHMIAEGTPFLVPVVVDETRDGEALVPAEFKAVQWTRLRLAGQAGQPRDGVLERFCARVRALLDGEGAAAAPGPAPISPRRATKRPASRGWLWPAGFSFAAAVALAIWQPWKKSAPAATPPLSEARKLVAQARVLFEGDELLRENFSLAEELLTKAQALDETDGEVWAARAELSHDAIFAGLSLPSARLDNLRVEAERAKALAPGSIEAQLAYAGYHQVVGRNSTASAAEAVRLLQPLVERAPTDHRVYRMLGFSLITGRSLDEGVTVLDRANALPGGDPLALQMKGVALFLFGRYEEAEAAIAQSLALRPTGRARVVDTLIKLAWRGDLDGAAASLAQWPAQMALEPRGAFIASQVWLWRHQPDKAIEVLRAFTSDSINDLFFNGPKSGLLALAYEMAGRSDAAQAEWENTQNIVTRLLAENPAQQPWLPAWKAVALARLGKIAEAESLLRQLEQTSGLDSSFWSCGATAALLRIAVNRGGEVAAKFDSDGRTEPGKIINVPSPQPALKLNPVFDPIRTTPEFQKWMAAAPAPKPKVASASAAGEKSVAVLAFSDDSPARDSEYFSDGISDELINVLGRVPGLKVSARASSFSFKGKNVPIPEIARQLGVTLVVEGSVQRAGDKVKIGARLTQAADGFQVSLGTFQRDAKDVFAVEEEIAGLVAQNLQLKLGYAPRTAKAINPEAHRLVLEGLQYWNHRTEEGFARAEKLFSAAREIDSDFAPASAGLAQVFSVRANFRLLDGRPGGKEDTARALAEARRAIELDATLAEPPMSLGFALLQEHRWDEAEQWFRRSTELNPNYAIAHFQYHLLFRLRGQMDRAFEEVEAGLELDPLSYIGLWLKAACLKNVGRYTEALVVNERAGAAAAALGIPPAVTILGNRVEILLALGRIDDAKAVAREILRDPEATPRREADALAIWALCRAGFQTEARADAAVVEKRIEAESFQRGLVLVAQGDFDAALPLLEQVPPNAFDLLYTSALFDAYRDDPRFLQLMKKLGCAEEYRVARETLARMRLDQRAKK
ncbi:MAG TPA: TIR domain-containing protein [Opitutaceae bacterium]|nr:TIR domain-containing protein [Opitutaceae bacterium]